MWTPPHPRIRRYHNSRWMVKKYCSGAFGLSDMTADPKRLSADSHQIGGHQGAILTDGGKLYKKCDSVAEKTFYLQTSGHARLGPFLPTFYGVCRALHLLRRQTTHHG